MTETHRFLPEINMDLPSTNLHYSRACIVEAVIEFRCVLDEAVTIDDLTATMADEDDYSQSEKLFEAESTVDVSGSALQGQTTGSIIGFCYTRADGARKVFVKRDGFAFSWVGQYENWTAFLAEAWAYWRKFAAAIAVKSVERVGVRYINRFDIRGRHIEISDYLRTTVNVSPYLPQVIMGYYLQVQVPVHKYDGIATITSTIAPPQAEDALSLVLDIDCWRVIQAPAESDENEGTLSTTLADLRLMKNFVFEACITDATRGLIG